MSQPQVNPKKDSVLIIARRWFDRINGNTYHSVKVLVNNKEIGYCPIAYGYGECFQQTAVDLLVKAGCYIKEVAPDRTYGCGTFIKGADRTYWNFLNDMRENRDNFLVFVTDVPRKKDLAF